MRHPLSGHPTEYLFVPTPDALMALLMRHYPSLYGFAYALLGNHEDAEDALQNAALVLAAKHNELDTAENFLPWARAVVRLEVLAARRRRGRAPLLEDPAVIELLVAGAEAADHATDDAGRREALFACVESLPAADREVLRLRYSGEIAGVGALAQRIGRSVPATYSLLKRCRQAVRACVERKLSGGK